MSKIKVLDISEYIRIVCTRDTGININPYRLYIVYKSIDRYGYPAEHKKQVARYQDMSSILCMVKDLYTSGIQFKPIDSIIAWCKRYYRE